VRIKRLAPKFNFGASLFYLPTFFVKAQKERNTSLAKKPQSIAALQPSRLGHIWAAYPGFTRYF
ncbi:MAG TPA: hypothetical protein PLG66_20280, partial [Calditrichia bacterium]|nr:hypothetical protein [Calditrichia bacterium]